MQGATAEMLQRILQALPAWRPYASVLESVLVAARMTEYVRCSPGFGKLTKADTSPVTVADLAAQMAVVNGIKSAFPTDLIIAEEDSSSLTDAVIRAELQKIVDKFNVHVTIELYLYFYSVVV